MGHSGLFKSPLLPLPTPGKRGKGGEWKPPRLPCPTPRRGATVPSPPDLVSLGTLLCGDDGNGSRAWSGVGTQHSTKPVDRQFTCINSLDFLRELMANLVVRLSNGDMFYPGHCLYQLGNARIGFAARAGLLNGDYLAISQ